MEHFATIVKQKEACWGIPRKVTLKQIADITRSPRYERQAARLYSQVLQACMLQDSGGRQTLSACSNLPYIVFPSLFGQCGVHDFQQPTGLVLLSVLTDADQTRTASLRHTAATMPQTVMVFQGSSRRTLKIVVRCQPDGACLPTEAEAYCDFLVRAHRQAARLYEAVLQSSIRPCRMSLTSGCRMSHDPQVMYNPKALPLTVMMNEPSGCHTAAADSGRKQSVAIPTARDSALEQADFYACLKTALQMAGCSGGFTSDAEKITMLLAKCCRKAAIGEESAVRRTLMIAGRSISESSVRSIFQTVYRATDNGRTFAMMPEKERVARLVHDFFQRRYELRYNTMKGIEEFRPRGIDGEPWKTLTDRDMRRIGHEQMMDCGAAWPMGVEQYARSSFAKEYNPIHDFLNSCGRWNRRHDYIGKMAARVPCEYDEWPRLFHRWFLGMVAAWKGLSEEFANAVVPMLIGPQGVGKTTFCKLLMPPSLREYYIDDIKMNNAEQVERMLTRMALVNIDEYNAKTMREQARIKRVLTEHHVQIRHMRSEQYVLKQRMASFIATTNETKPLSDMTGNRRYLCVEVKARIDTQTPVNYQQLYAQALWEIEHGERYYMDDEEQVIMERHNSRFLNAPATNILLSSYYKPAARSRENFMTAADILADLQQKAAGCECPNMNSLVRALKAAHFEYGANKGMRGWYVKKISL